MEKFQPRRICYVATSERSLARSNGGGTQFPRTTEPFAEPASRSCRAGESATERSRWLQLHSSGQGSRLPRRRYGGSSGEPIQCRRAQSSGTTTQRRNACQLWNGRERTDLSRGASHVRASREWHSYLVALAAQTSASPGRRWLAPCEHLYDPACLTRGGLPLAKESGLV